MRQRQRNKGHKETEKPRNYAAVITAVATGVIALFTVVLAWVSARQLGELHDSGVQMDRLILQNRMQAEQLTKQATDTHELANQAKNQADQTKTIAAEVIIQATATKDLATSSATQLEMANRPWVTIDYKIDAPLTFIANGVGATINMVTRNIGHSLATKIVQEQELIMGMVDSRSAMEKACKKAQAAIAIDPVHTDSLINDQHWDQNITLLSGKKELDDMLKKTHGFLGAQVVFCTAYGSNIGPTTYETGNSFWLSDRGGLFLVNAGDMSPIPPERLQLNAEPWATTRAK